MNEWMNEWMMNKHIVDLPSHTILFIFPDDINTFTDNFFYLLL